MGGCGVSFQNKHPHFYNQHRICPLDPMIIEAFGNNIDLEEQRDKRKSTVFVDYNPSDHAVYINIEGWKLLLDSEALYNCILH